MKKILCLALVLLTSALFLCSCKSNYYREYEVSTFGEKTYNEINEPCSAKDKAALQPVLELAEKAFSSFPDSEETAKKEFGELYYYTNFYDDSFEKPITEKHEINFITGKVNGNNGYIWLNYTRENFDAKGKTIMGDADINTRWTLKKKNGEWGVPETLEAP